MSNRFRRCIASAGLLSALGVAATQGQPSDPPGPNVALRIAATTTKGMGYIDLMMGDFYRNATDHTYDWSLETPAELRNQSGDTVIATINSLDLVIRRWSQFDLALSIDVGQDGVVITIESTSVAFPLLAPDIAVGRARARFFVTDLDGDGAALYGVGALGSGAFVARYHNATGQERVFGQLVGGVVCGPGGSGYGEQRDPFSGYRTLKDGATSINVTSAFSMTPNDRVIVTSRFDVNPDPPNCVADFDEDGFVNVEDLLTLLQNFGRAGALFDNGDTDGDGDVDFADLMRLMTDYGVRCP